MHKWHLQNFIPLFINEYFFVFYGYILILIYLQLQNLLVTSTLTVCTDPYPQTMTKSPEESEKISKELHLHSHSVQSGVEPMVGDGDEVMLEVEHGEIDDEMTIDLEALDEIVGSSETNSKPTGTS